MKFAPERRYSDPEKPHWFRFLLLPGSRREMTMPKKEEPLKPQNFPVQANDKTIVTNDGKLADVCDQKTAQDLEASQRA